MSYESYLMETRRVSRGEAVELARRAERVMIKVGHDILRFDRVANPITDDQIHSYLVHDDGFLRVPVLAMGDLLVRGYTEDLYWEALGPSATHRG